jgi:uncharacterized PurR-regulated membrane protein YhhQ (DUF165 family)
VGLRSLSYNVFLQDSFESVPGLLLEYPRMGVVMNLDVLLSPLFFVMDLINKCFGIHGKFVCVCVVFLNFVMTLLISILEDTESEHKLLSRVTRHAS